MENIIALVVTEKIKGIIYKLYNKNDENIFYIGSSTQSLYNRTHEHKRKAKKGTTKLYNYIRDNEGIENFISEVIENVEVENIHELRKKEQDFIILLKPPLNSNNATVNIKIDQRIDKKLYHKEYQQTEGYKNYQKEYQQTEAYKNYKKQYNNTEKHKEYIKIYSSTKKIKDYHKSYREQHAAKIKDYMKIYRQNHKKVKLI